MKHIGKLIVLVAVAGGLIGGGLWYARVSAKF
jgi:hypothetical protein